MYFVVCFCFRNVGIVGLQFHYFWSKSFMKFVQNISNFLKVLKKVFLHSTFVIVFTS